MDALRPLLPPPPADILDVGTGTGFLALLLAELGHRVSGIDLSEGMLVRVRRSLRCIGQPPPSVSKRVRLALSGTPRFDETCTG
jgi:protein-L-isoaspartate O-methyltransferase